MYNVLELLKTKFHDDEERLSRSISERKISGESGDPL